MAAGLIALLCMGSEVTTIMAYLSAAELKELKESLLTQPHHSCCNDAWCLRPPARAGGQQFKSKDMSYWTIPARDEWTIDMGDGGWTPAIQFCPFCRERLPLGEQQVVANAEVLEVETTELFKMIELAFDGAIDLSTAARHGLVARWSPEEAGQETGTVSGEKPPPVIDYAKPNRRSRSWIAELPGISSDREDREN